MNKRYGDFFIGFITGLAVFGLLSLVLLVIFLII